MPSQLALLFCILFVVFVLKKDSNRASRVSHAIWIPVIWILIAMSRLLSQWLNLSDLAAADAYVEGNAFDRLLFLSLIIGGTFVIWKRNILSPKIMHANAAFLLLLSYGAISIAWSDFPIVAFKRWIKELGNPIMVLVILSEEEPIEAIKTVFRKCSIILVPFSILLIKYYRNMGVSYSTWTGEQYYLGVTSGKNALGRLCLVLGYIISFDFFTAWQKRRLSNDKAIMRLDILFLVMIAWLLIKSNSATSLACLIISVLTFVGLTMPIIRKKISFIGLFMLIISVTYFFLDITVGITEALISSLGRNVTLTGRTDLWKFLLQMDVNPLFGSGFASFWLGDRLTEIWDLFWWHPNESHNGYLEIYLNQGLIGLVLFIFIIISAYKNIKNELIYNFETGQFKLGFLIMSLFYNLTEASFVGLNPIFIGFLLCAIRVPKPAVDIQYLQFQKTRT